MTYRITRFLVTHSPSNKYSEITTIINLSEKQLLQLDTNTNILKGLLWFLSSYVISAIPGHPQGPGQLPPIPASPCVWSADLVSQPASAQKDRQTYYTENDTILRNRKPRHILTSVSSHGWSCARRSQTVSAVKVAQRKRFCTAAVVQMYLYRKSFPVCSEMALADITAENTDYRKTEKNLCFTNSSLNCKSTPFN